MRHACAAPLSADVIVDYLADDLDAAAAAAVEETVFSCAACQARADGLMTIVRALRADVPVVVTPAQVADLRAAGRVVEENAFSPGVSREVVFRPDVDLLIHRLGGLDLSDADRVEVRVRFDASGKTIFEDPFAPFVRERGEVLIACQRHFAGFPPDVVFDVRVFSPSRPPATVSYPVPHVFMPRP